MRPWMINLGVSLVMFICTIGSFRLLQVTSTNITYAPQRYPGYPFTPGPRYTPTPPSPEQIASAYNGKCLAAFSRNVRAKQEYVVPYCDCSSSHAVGVRREIMYAENKKCEMDTLRQLSTRSDLKERFEAQFSSACSSRFIEPDGRIGDSKVPLVCACIQSHVSADKMRMSAYAFEGAEDDSKNLSTDRDQCAAETNAYQSTGWQVGERNGKTVAVIELPEHHDIRNLILSCTPQNQMEMKLEYWPHPNRITRLQRDADSYNSGWMIQFQNERAVGKQVSDFYQMALDHLEAGGEKPDQFAETIPDPSNRRDIEVRFGDFAKVTNPVIQACIPSVYGNMNLPAPTQAAAPSNALPDRWSYAGRAANYNFPGEFDDTASLNYLQFACDSGKPLLGLGGRITDDLTKRSKLSLSPADGAQAALKTECAPEEGGTVCYASPSASLLKFMSGSNAIKLQVGDKNLGLFPFGGSPNIRKVLQYCKYESAVTASVAAKLPPAAPSSRVSLGSTITLSGPMNLRAFPADDGRLLRKLPVGTQVRIVRKANDRRGNVWSAVALAGQQEAGYMKDVALLVNIDGSNASAQ